MGTSRDGRIHGAKDRPAHLSESLKPKLAKARSAGSVYPPVRLPRPYSQV